MAITLSLSEDSNSVLVITDDQPNGRFAPFNSLSYSFDNGSGNRGYVSITAVFSGRPEELLPTPLSEINDGDFSNIDEFKTFFQGFFRKATGGGGGSSAWSDITGKPTGNNRQVITFNDSGNMIAARLGWAQFSDLPTPPTFLNGVLAGTAFSSDGTALFAFIELALGEGGTALVKPNAIPFYNPGQIGTGGGTIAVADAIEDGEAINKGQLNIQTLSYLLANGGALPTFSATAINGADTILSALIRLQAQINALIK